MSLEPLDGFGQPHTLVVTSVTPPEGQFDDGEMEYEIEHPATCREYQAGEGEHAYTAYECDVSWNIDAVGLAFTLKYSGTPITEPGTYRIQGWWSKHYVWDAGAYEYDAGIGVMDDEETAEGAGQEALL